MGRLTETSVGGAPPLGPCAERERDHNGFIEAVGERIALLGADEGRMEIWMWPLLVAHDLRVCAGPAGGALQPLGERSIRAVPEGFAVTWQLQGASITMTAVAMGRAPGLVLLFEIELGAAPMDLAVTFVPALRPMWPAGLGGQVVGRDDATGAVVLTEETGRFTAFLGSPGSPGARVDLEAAQRGATTGHGLPAPIELRLGIDRSRDADDPVVVAVAGSTDGTPDGARALLRRLWTGWREVIATERARWRAYLDDTPTLETGDIELDAAFQWSKIAIERAWVDVEGLGRGVVAGYGAAHGGARPGHAWFYGASSFEACRAFAALGRFEACRDILRFAAQTQRGDGQIAREITLAAKLCNWFDDYPHAFGGGGETRAFLAALTDYAAWSGDGAFLDELHPAAERARTWCGDGMAPDTGATFAALTDAEVLALNRPETMADWGWRRAGDPGSLGSADPTAIGDVSPSQTQHVVRELYARGFHDVGWQILRSQAELLGMGGPGLLPQTLMPDRARPVPHSAPHGLSSHAALVRMVTDGLLGLDAGAGDAAARVPLELEQVVLHGAHGRDGRFDVRASRAQSLGPRAAFPWQVDLYAPSVNTRLIAVETEGASTSWTIAGPSATTVRIPFDAPSGLRIEGARMEGDKLVVAFPIPIEASTSSTPGFGTTTVRFVDSALRGRR